MTQLVVFFLLAIITLGSAIAVICLKNLVHSTLMLIVSFLGVAGIYLSLRSDYLAGVQVMVYAGAVAILIVLAILLIKRGSATLDETNLFAFDSLPNAIAAVIFGGVIIFSLVNTKWPGMVETSAIADSTTEALATGLLSEYVVAFELAAVLLLIAMVAAIIISREVKHHV